MRNIKNLAPGSELRALLNRHRLTGNEGAQFAAKLIRVEPNTLQSYLTRGIDRNLLELLACKLTRKVRTVPIKTAAEIIKAGKARKQKTPLGA